MRALDHLLGWIRYRRRLAAARAWREAQWRDQLESARARQRLLDQARGEL